MEDKLPHEYQWVEDNLRNEIWDLIDRIEALRYRIELLEKKYVREKSNQAP